MDNSANELQIVQAFSKLTIPEKIIQDSNIGDLIKNTLADKKSVSDENSRLQELRDEQKKGNFASNLWNDRDGKIKDAHLDLNQSIGRLTQSSSVLLVLNTAMSKVLSHQQTLVLKQQEQLEEQAHELKLQNEKIFTQHELLAEQKKEANAANQELLQAMCIAQEQANKLVSCITLVMETENRINAANEALRFTLTNDMRDAVVQCEEHIGEARIELRSLQKDFEQRQDEVTQSLSIQVRDGLEQLASNSETFRSDVTAQLQTHMQATLNALAKHDIAATQTALVANQVETKQKVLESSIVSLQAQQAKTARQNRISFSIGGCVVVLSLGWQVANHFLNS